MGSGAGVGWGLRHQRRDAHRIHRPGPVIQSGVPAGRALARYGRGKGAAAARYRALHPSSRTDPGPGPDQRRVTVMVYAPSSPVRSEVARIRYSPLSGSVTVSSLSRPPPLSSSSPIAIHSPSTIRPK